MGCWPILCPADFQAHQYDQWKCLVPLDRFLGVCVTEIVVYQNLVQTFQLIFSIIQTPDDWRLRSTANAVFKHSAKVKYMLTPAC